MLFFCILMSGNVLLAQSKPYFSVQSTEPEGFVWIKARKGKKAAEQINTYLQLYLFQRLLQEGRDSVPGKWAVHLHLNNKNVLSFSLTDSISGQQEHFVFNAATGALIDVQDIVNPNGIAHIKRVVTKTYKQHVQQEQLPLDINSSAKCLKDDYHRMQLFKDSMVIETQKCRFIDTISNEERSLPMRHTFGTDNISRYFTNYGVAAMGFDKRLKMRKMYSNFLPGLYYGNQDGEPVILLVEAPMERTIKGVLYYRNARKSLPFEGSFKSNRVVANTPGGALNLIISAGRAQGTIKTANKTSANLVLQKLQ